MGDEDSEVRRQEELVAQVQAIAHSSRIPKEVRRRFLDGFKKQSPLLSELDQSQEKEETSPTSPFRS